MEFTPKQREALYIDLRERVTWYLGRVRRRMESTCLSIDDPQLYALTVGIHEAATALTDELHRRIVGDWGCKETAIKS